MSVRVVFAGTPDFAAASLRALLQAQVEPLAVFTQPDRPAGRGRKLHPSPVKQIAVGANLPVRQPIRLSEEISYLTSIAPDVLIVVAYGLILPRAVLDIPSQGCINVHASLLPRWRGAAPIQRAIEAGDPETGITLMRIDEQVDTGDVLSQAPIPILETDTSASLHDRLASLGAQELVRMLPSIVNGTATAIPQDHSLASYAQKVRPAESRLDWGQPARVLDRQIRAFNPWPLCRTALDGNVLLIRQACLGRYRNSDKPGTIIETNRDRIRVQTGDGTLDVVEVQSPGRKPLAVTAFLNGHPLRPGQRFHDEFMSDAQS